MGQQLINWGSVNWAQLQAQAQALVVQYAPYVTQWAQASGQYSPMLAEKANQAGGRLGNLGNQAGNTAGPGGFDPNNWGPIQERIVREQLEPYFDQAFGATDDAIRKNLGTEGRTADFVGRAKSGDGWLIAESKGTNLDHAYSQLQSTYRALVDKVPTAKGNTSLRIYMSESAHNRLLNGDLLGWEVQNRVLGWTPEGGSFTPLQIDDALVKIIVVYQ